MVCLALVGPLVGLPAEVQQAQLACQAVVGLMVGLAVEVQQARSARLAVVGLMVDRCAGPKGVIESLIDDQMTPRSIACYC